MGLKLSNLSQQAYVTKTGIPMFVLGMFKSLQYFKCEVSHSFPLNASIGTLQPHPFDVFDSSAFSLTKQPPLPEWIEFLHCSAVPSTLVLTLYVHHVWVSLHHPKHHPLNVPPMTSYILQHHGSNIFCYSIHSDSSPFHFLFLHSLILPLCFLCSYLFFVSCRLTSLNF